MSETIYTRVRDPKTGRLHIVAKRATKKADQVRKARDEGGRTDHVQDVDASAAAAEAAEKEQATKDARNARRKAKRAAEKAALSAAAAQLENDEVSTEEPPTVDL